MSKYKRRCNCKGITRPENSLLLTKHHPECPAFNPSSELKSMESQCAHFLRMISDLQAENKELREKLEAYE